MNQFLIHVDNTNTFFYFSNITFIPYTFFASYHLSYHLIMIIDIVVKLSLCITNVIAHKVH